MSHFETIPDADLQPAARGPESSTHQTPLYVVAFTGEHLKHPKIITLRGAHLLRGLRNSVQSIGRNANDIAAIHQLRTTAHHWLYVPKEEAQGSLGYSVARAHRSPLPLMADFTRTEPTADHTMKLELHDYDQLNEYLTDQPDRQLEASYLRAFGAVVLDCSRPSR